MIEIRVPKEIKNYKSKLFFGMSVRQCVCFGAALGICVPLYIWGKKVIDEEIVSWLVILIASPLLLMGFFSYNGMHFEAFAKEWFLYNFVNVQRRKYEYEPIFMSIRNNYLAEEFEDEKIKRKEELKHNKKKKGKKHCSNEHIESGVDKNAQKG